MAFGQTVRFHRNDKGFGLNEFAERLGVSPAYWSRVEREQENPPYLGGDIKAVVTLYRRSRDTRNSNSK